LSKAVAAGKLRATTEVGEAVRRSAITLICVGTPNGPSGMDLSQVLSAAEGVGAALKCKTGYHVVAVKSTVLPGTTAGIVKNAIEVTSGINLGESWGLCMTPEFLREGQAVEDCLSPDRIIIGASDHKAGEFLLGMYGGSDCPKIITSLQTAEMTKYVANSLFATLISFSNEIANLCSSVSGINAQEVWKGVHLDRRLTPLDPHGRRPAGVVEYLWHGLGFGGSCFPKDLSALREMGKKLGASTPILDSVLTTNSNQPLRLVTLIETEMNLENKTVAILGLAFKPGTDDLRESPALPVIARLIEKKAHVIAHDPIAMPRAQSNPAFQKVDFASDWSATLRNSDACCLVTAWPEYKEITAADFKNLMRNPLVIDGRGFFDPRVLAQAGVRWRGVGHDGHLSPEF
jgi:UDPglucose 6-dehydrogenase/GDP-mannose 6-dehydrogenase